MLFQILRLTLAGKQYKVALNTDRVIKVEPTVDKTKPRTTIVYDQGVPDERPSIIYTDEDPEELQARILPNTKPKKRKK